MYNPQHQNWIVDNSKKPLMSKPYNPNQQSGKTPLPPGISGGSDGFVRQVQKNELAGTHMEELGRNDNRILQQARQRGVLAGASRGGINSNLAAAGGESAWLDAAGNVAMQQAGAYGTAAGQNLDSLGRQRISAEGNQTQLEAANISANTSMFNANLNAASDKERIALERERMGQDREMTLGDREYRAQQENLDRQYRAEQAERGDERQFGYTRQLERDRFGYDQTAEGNRLNRTVAGEVFSRMLDSPEEWDQYTASGAVDFFSQYLNPNGWMQSTSSASSYAKPQPNYYAKPLPYNPT